MNKQKHKKAILDGMKAGLTLHGEKMEENIYLFSLGDPSPMVDPVCVRELLQAGTIEISCQDDELIFLRLNPKKTRIRKEVAL